MPVSLENPASIGKAADESITASGPAAERRLASMELSSIPSVFVLGCRIHRVTMDEAVETSKRFLSDGRAHMIVTADSSMLEMAIHDRELRDLINAADLVVPDSTGVVWASRRLGSPVPERVPGVDLMERLCMLGSETPRTAFFLGAAPGVAEEAARRLEAKHPGLRVVGFHHGFFNPGDEERIEARIRELRPDLLFVAMGIPRQEKWIRARMANLGVPLAMGVGGSFDCHSGRVRRAPEFFRRTSMEWLYRLASNPKKYRKVALLPRFAWRVWCDGRGSRGTGGSSP